jgi:hypothetical protein
MLQFFCRIDNAYEIVEWLFLEMFSVVRAPGDGNSRNTHFISFTDVANSIGNKYGISGACAVILVDQLELLTFLIMKVSTLMLFPLKEKALKHQQQEYRPLIKCSHH